MQVKQPKNAFVLRIAPGGVDHVAEALETGDLMMGWDCGPELLEMSDSWDRFRNHVHTRQFPGEKGFRRSSAAAGNLWRFLVDMKEGDFALIPHGHEFYVAKVAGPARYHEQGQSDDTAYRRKTEPLNSGRPVPRAWARAGLQARLKVRQTCAYARDLVGEVLDVLDAARGGTRPTFADDLRRKLTQEALVEIRQGRMNPDSFEELVRGLLLSLGAEEAWIVGRRSDKGADVVAKFRVGGTFMLTVAAQAKHYAPEPPVGPDVIDQLALGMEAEEANLGWVVTSGSFSSEAVSRAQKCEEEQNFQIQLIDGEQLAAMIVDTGAGWKTEETS